MTIIIMFETIVDSFYIVCPLYFSFHSGVHAGTVKLCHISRTLSVTVCAARR